MNDFFIVFWVDKHDDAYRWARRYFEHDEVIIRICTYEEGLQNQRSRRGMFNNISDEELKKIGLPDVFRCAIRSIENESQFDTLKSYLPAGLFEDLFYLAQGESAENLLISRIHELEARYQEDFRTLETLENAKEITSLNLPFRHGQKIRDKYVIEHLVGIDPQEHRSAVYKVKDIDNRYAQLALKVFLIDDERTDKIIENELRVRQRVAHRNLSRCFGSDRLSPGGERFLVIEYHEGTILSKLIKERTSKHDEKINYSIQILSGLRKLHEAGFVHGKISPEHIVLDEQGTIKIVSFDNSGPPKGDTPLSWGINRYMPPDYLTEGWHYAWDTYGAGVILFQLFTGEMPDVNNPRIPKAQRRQLGATVSNFLETACQPLKIQRYKNASVMLESFPFKIKLDS
jgi:hypothetical protein